MKTREQNKTEAAEVRATEFFSKNPELANEIEISELHAERISTAKKHGFFGNYQQPAFFKALKPLVND